jgi:hypothetical protein
VSRAYVLAWQPKWDSNLLPLWRQLSYRNLHQALACWSQTEAEAIKVEVDGQTLIIRRKRA